jgi:hypothetical protein
MTERFIRGGITGFSVGGPMHPFAVLSMLYKNAQSEVKFTESDVICRPISINFSEVAT